MYDKSLLVTPDVVPCCDKPVMAMRMPDDRIAATLHSLCDAVQLDYIGQLQRIQRQPSLAKWLHRISVLTLAGQQEVDVLIVTAIPAWLIGIQLNRLAPEKQALILRFQDEAVDALYRHFFQADTGQTAQPAAKKLSDPDGAPGEWIEAEPLSSVPDTIWERLYEVMSGFERKWQAMEQDIAGLKTELVEIRQQLRGASAAGQSQRDKRPLSLEHIMQLHTLARALESQSGEPVSALFRQLAEVFDVTDVSAIPDAGWDHILTWFWQHTQH
jgi:hypothetical protein